MSSSPDRVKPKTIKLVFVASPQAKVSKYIETRLNRTLSKPKTCLNQTKFTVPSTKCLCNLNLCKSNTCLNWTNSSVPKGFCLDRFYCIYRDVTSARSCNKVGHLFWFTILAQHETNDVILYIHSIHKHRENSFQRQNYKMRLKQRSLNWINSMQVKKIFFTNVFFSWSLCLFNMFPSMVFPKHFYFSGLLT